MKEKCGLAENVDLKTVEGYQKIGEIKKEKENFDSIELISESNQENDYTIYISRGNISNSKKYYKFEKYENLKIPNYTSDQINNLLGKYIFL